MKRSVVLFDEPLTVAALERKLARLGFGMFHVQTIISCGFFLFFSSAITTLNRELLEQPKSPFISHGDDGIDRFVFAITPFVGSMIGFLINFTNFFSRKFLVIFSYAVIGLCTLMAALSNTSSLHVTLAWLAGAHVGFGLGFPAAILTVYESSPVSLRTVSLALLFTFQIIGEAFVGIINRIEALFVSDICPEKSALCIYRSLGLESVAIPIFCALVFSAFWVHESPFALQSDCFKLNGLLRHIRDTNGLSESDVVIKFVPPTNVENLQKIERISNKNIAIFSGIFFTCFSFTFVFPHPDNHWIVWSGLEVGILALITSLVYFIWRFENFSTRPISATLFLLSALCALGAWQASINSSWGRHVQSWFVLGVVKSLSLSLVVLSTRFVCELSSCYISLILAIAYGGCIIFPNSISVFSSAVVPLEITYAALFGFACIAFAFIEIPTKPGSKVKQDSLGNFSKIPLIGQVPPRNYGSAGA